MGNFSFPSVSFMVGTVPSMAIANDLNNLIRTGRERKKRDFPDRIPGIPAHF